MQLNDRLRIKRLIELLASDSSTFDCNVAKDLIQKVPFTRPTSPLSAEINTTSAGGSMQPASASAASLPSNMADDKVYRFGQGETFNSGFYKLEHIPGRLTISHIFSGTYDDETGRSFRIIYDKFDGSPKEMKIAEQTSLGFGFFSISLLRYKPWKRPWKIH